MTKFAFFDLDRTLYDGISTSDFYFLMANNGLADKSIFKKDEELTNKYLTGQYSYDQIGLEVISLGIELLKDLTRKQVLELEDEFIKLSLKFYPYTRPLIKLLQQNGYICYLVSAAIFPPVEAISRELKMPFFASTGYLNGHTYTGELQLFLNGEAKSEKIREVLTKAEQPTFCLAFGDSTGDLPLLEAADKAFVINPHQPEMTELANKHGYILANIDNIIHLVKNEL